GPGKVVDNHQQGIDPCRWMKRAGDNHRSNGHSNRGGRRPAVRAGQLKHCEPGQGRHEVPADQRARLRRLCFRRSDDEHDGGRKGDDNKWKVRCDRQPLHRADGDGGPKACDGSLHRVAQADATPSTAGRLWPFQTHLAHRKKKGGRSLCRTERQKKINYFRLVTADRSAETFTPPVALHQWEPTPRGLIAVTKDTRKSTRLNSSLLG